jgi:hypothetical protein
MISTNLISLVPCLLAFQYAIRFEEKGEGFENGKNSISLLVAFNQGNQTPLNQFSFSKIRVLLIAAL